MAPFSIEPRQSCKQFGHNRSPKNTSDAPALSLSLNMDAYWQKLRKKTGAQKCPVMYSKHVNLPGLREQLPRGNKKAKFPFPQSGTQVCLVSNIDHGVKQKKLEGRAASIHFFSSSSLMQTGLGEREGGPAVAHPDGSSTQS